MSRPNWDDLRPRVLSAIAMLLIGVEAVWLGGVWFHLLISLVCGLMVWELTRMTARHQSDHAILIGALAAVCLYVGVLLPLVLGLLLICAPSALVLLLRRRAGLSCAIYTLAILVAGHGLMELRDEFGIVWIAWLLSVVVATDVAGYFAGRVLGGPKLWPRFSPKKTWSGAIAGWLASGLVGAIFAGPAGIGLVLVFLSVAVSMASQAGDIAESAVKRRAGVKDSSGLIPGHGGVLDRFDGVLGGALLIMLLGLMTGFPPGG